MIHHDRKSYDSLHTICFHIVPHPHPSSNCFTDHVCPTHLLALKEATAWTPAASKLEHKNGSQRVLYSDVAERQQPQGTQGPRGTQGLWKQLQGHVMLSCDLDVWYPVSILDVYCRCALSYIVSVFSVSVLGFSQVPSMSEACSTPIKLLGCVSQSVPAKHGYNV